MYMYTHMCYNFFFSFSFFQVCYSKPFLLFTCDHWQWYLLMHQKYSYGMGILKLGLKPPARATYRIILEVHASSNYFTGTESETGGRFQQSVKICILKTQPGGWCCDILKFENEYCIEQIKSFHLSSYNCFLLYFQILHVTFFPHKYHHTKILSLFF